MKYTKAIPAMGELQASPDGKIKRAGVSITSMLGAFPRFSSIECLRIIES